MEDEAENPHPCRKKKLNFVVKANLVHLAKVYLLIIRTIQSHFSQIEARTTKREVNDLV